MLALLMPLTMFSLFDMILTLIVTHVIQLMNQVKKLEKSWPWVHINVMSSIYVGTSLDPQTKPWSNFRI